MDGGQSLRKGIKHGIGAMTPTWSYSIILEKEKHTSTSKRWKDSDRQEDLISGGSAGGRQVETE